MANQYSNETYEDKVARFWSHADKSGGEDTCWVWSGSMHPDGYGYFRWQDKKQRAHRIAYMLLSGDIPKNLNVCHSCDNPSCVNPAHLFLGTQQDNMTDKVRKGRHSSPVGEDHGLAKFTWEAVREIRRRYAAGGIMQKELADEFGVTQTAISRVVNYKRWKE